MTASSIPPFPGRIAWEITRRCNLPCAHCVNASGRPAPGELTTTEALDVCQQLVAAGALEVAFTGGEPFLRGDLNALIAYLAGAGLKVSVQTGGRGLHEATLTSAKAAGLTLLGVSIDGLEATHDAQRGWAGSFSAGLQALRLAKSLGLSASVNTQLNQQNLEQLEALYEQLEQTGADLWQPALTVAAGRASAHADRILQPWQVVNVLERLAELRGRRLMLLASQPGSAPRLDIQINANLGYFGPHEALLRSRPGQLRHWMGCPSGRHVLFIEADGTVTGSPFLPREPYACGSVRTSSLKALWESPVMRWTGAIRDDERWGFCRTCDYGELCGGGCQLTATMTLGRRGNNPFCAHRVLMLARAGIRERLIPWEQAGEQAPGPGRFVLVEELCSV